MLETRRSHRILVAVAVILALMPIILFFGKYAIVLVVAWAFCGEYFLSSSCH